MSSPTSQLKSKFVRAGAGAGKTTALTQYVISSAKLFQKQTGRYPRIVVTTFTRKATQELRERLIRAAFKDEDLQLVDYVSSKSQTLISTLHGVFHLFLKRYGHLLQQDPHFTLLSAPQEHRLVKMAIRESLLADPTNERWLDVFDVQRLSRIVGQYCRVVRMHPSLRPIQLTDLQFDFSERISKWQVRCQSLFTMLRSCEDKAFHEFGVELASALRFLETVTPENFIENVEKMKIPRKPTYREGKSLLSTEDHQMLTQLLSEIKSELSTEALNPVLWVERVERTFAFGEFLESVRTRFEQAKQDQSALTIDDLEIQCLDAQRQVPELASAFSADFDLWLVDEFQDTSPIQVEILRGFMGRQPRFVVGDPQQSIYLFRGARSEVFHQYQNEMKLLAAEQSNLDQNFRSQPKLLEFFNSVFNRLNPQFASMRPGVEDDNGRSVPATVSWLQDASTERDAVVARLVSLVSEGINFRDICVLGRTNLELQELSDAAAKAGLPVYIHQTQGFYERREIQDALALLRWMLNPFDNENLMILLRCPWFQVPDAVLAEAIASRPKVYDVHFRKELRNEPGWVRLMQVRLNLEQKGLLTAFEQAVTDLKLIESALRDDPSGRRESNLWKLVLLLRQKFREPGFVLMQFLREETASLNLEFSEDGDAVSTLEPNRIQFMTVHASKGLQFSHVLLARMGQRPQLCQAEAWMHDEERGFWTVPWPEGESASLQTSWTEQKILERRRDRERLEHQRVLYVALTRAQHSVHLFGCGQPQTDSWGQHLQWLWQRDPGLHNLDNGVSYEVLNEPVSWDQVEQRESRPNKKVRKPFLENQENGTLFNSAHVSVTQLLQKERTPYSRTALIHSSLRGIELHRYLEGLKYDPSLSASKPEFQQALSYLKSLTHPPFAKLLESGFVEWGFQVQSEKGVIEGKIDLLGFHGDEIWIVDYKSGSPSRLQTAQEQLRLYAWCVAQKFAQNPIFLCAVYPFEETCWTEAYSRDGSPEAGKPVSVSS